MSVLLLLISALVLIYLGIGGTTAAAVMSIATVVGLFQDEWHLISILCGGAVVASPAHTSGHGAGRHGRGGPRGGCRVALLAHRYATSGGIVLSSGAICTSAGRRRSVCKLPRYAIRTCRGRNGPRNTNDFARATRCTG